MLTRARNNTTTTLLGIIIATGLMTIGGAIAPAAFAVSSNTNTHISAPVFQSNEQTSSPRTTATIKTTQVNSPDSEINAGSGKNSFGIGVSNQDNSQSSTARINQDVNIDQNANNFNFQGFDVQTTTTLFCIFTNHGRC
jgi:hypothetical protein